MVSKIFVDTNIFVATRDFNDSTHQKALKLTKYMEGKNCAWYTSSDVVGETLTVISQKLGKDIASDWHKDFLKSGIRVIFVDQLIHKKAKEFFLKTKQKNISFVDCSCVIAMKESNIDTIFSFDKDFKKMGMKLLGETKA